MEQISSILPSFAQGPLHFLEENSKEVSLAIPSWALCWKFFPPAAPLILSFSGSYLGTKLVIKLLSSYSKGVLQPMKKHVKHISKWILTMRIVAALATLILLSVAGHGLLIAGISGACFALIKAIDDASLPTFEQPKKKWFNYKGEG